MDITSSEKQGAGDSVTAPRIKGVFLDLDGTVYHGTAAVPGAADFVNRLKAENVVCLYVTNRANRSNETVCNQLRGMGIDCEPEDFLTTAQATAQHLKPGSVYYIGEPPLGDALMAKGHTISDEKADYVVVGYDPTLTYAKLEKATHLIRAGAQFVATNPDPVITTERGISPGNGSILAALITATGQEPIVIGKPKRLIVDIGLEIAGLPPEEVVMVGDNIDTDIPAGISAGTKTALILTGVSTREDLETSGIQPTWVAEDFEDLTRQLFE